MIQHIKEIVTSKYELRIIENTVDTLKDENTGVLISP
jgi:hypothetical protein